LKNGDLLREAEKEFDVCISTDQNLKYQQQATGRNPAILVLPTNDWPTIRSHAAEIAAKLQTLKPGDYMELSWLDA
jgi:hypothetical protein